MHQIDSANSVNRKFVAGNPATGVLPTFMTAEWCNAMQEELGLLVEYGGGVQDKANNGQVLAKILAIAQEAVDKSAGTPTAMALINAAGIGQVLTVSIDTQINIATVVRLSRGIYQLTFSTPMTNPYVVLVGTEGNMHHVGSYALDSSQTALESFVVIFGNDGAQGSIGSAYNDPERFSIVVYGGIS